MGKIISIERLEKTYITEGSGRVEAIGGVDLDVYENEFVCIIGPSGCGKSTMLRIIAGLEDATAGDIYYEGNKIKNSTKEIGMVFQNYSLLKWRTVEENITLGLEFQGVDKSKRKKIASEYLDMIGMKKFGKAFPYELSGGMQQRVAIARALANDPKVILMDEPFGALDAYTRRILQRELLNIWETNKKTIMFVTHSVDEAIYLADKIVVMSNNPGEIEFIIDVELDRPRDRSVEGYGELSDRLFNMLETLHGTELV